MDARPTLRARMAAARRPAGAALILGLVLAGTVRAAENSPPAGVEGDQATSAGPPLEARALAGPGRMRGEISYSRQEPVVGAVVIAVQKGARAWMVVGSTDTSGYFRFESIPAGTWSLSVLKEGAVPLTKSGISVEPPARAVVDIVLEKENTRHAPVLIDLTETARQTPAAAGGARSAKAGTPPLPLPDPASDGSRTHTPAAEGSQANPASRRRDSGGDRPPDESEDRALLVRVVDGAMRPIREARVSLRSRGPAVDPVRGATDVRGTARLTAPRPGEYAFAVESPGFLPIRVDRLALGREAPLILAFLTARPLDYPATPSDLLPEEKPIPPEGFPGGPADPDSGE